MSDYSRKLSAVIFAAILLISSGCGDRTGEKTPQAESPDDAGLLGRYIFESPVSFSDVGTIDVPRMAQAPRGAVQLVYLISEGTNQSVKYTRMENDEFRPPTFLSNKIGTKTGGGFIAAFSSSKFVSYWINVSAVGGELIYRATDDGGRTWSMETRYNNRSEARWPCILALPDVELAYFFVRSRNEWELVLNRSRSGDDESTVDRARGIPFHLQGFTDGKKKVWLAYFERAANANGGRIVLLRSEDGGVSFNRTYLFDDLMIPNNTSFFRILQDPSDGDVIHVIHSEESLDSSALYYSRSEDEGELFSAPISVISSEEPPLTYSPVILTNGRHVFIASADIQDDGPALRYVFSDDGGKSFDPPMAATREITNPETLTGTIDSNGYVLLVWDDLSNSGEAGEQLYMLKGRLRGR